MSMKGMNVEEAATTVQVLQAGATEIEGAMTKCTQAMQFEWHGEDAVRTKESWNTDYVGMLRTTIEALGSMAEQINRNREDQVNVSS